MKIVENTLDISLDDVLQRPLFCFFGTSSCEGHPRISPLWYLWEDERIWMIGDIEKSYMKRVEHQPQTSIAIVDFDVYSGRVHHIGMRGKAEIVPLEHDRMNRLLSRYLGEDKSEWDSRFVGLDPERWNFIRYEPEAVVARDQSLSPSLEEQE